ncbi:MAG: serine hydrolase [Chitinivibrionales bacterium]|nr:serine hydrolase [Chitinivibrionales bacterium]
MNTITIKGGHLHNLKGIDVSIPKNKLVVATGVSGSGKSSLVFDIIFEEGRKQYLQLLGVFAKIDDEDKFETISGIGPTIAVQQNIIRQSNPRSTVGSRTNILNMLAVLYASEGRIACSSCKTLVGDDLICKKCGVVEERFPASYFSCNNPNGMCLTCSGKGSYFQMNMKNLVPDEGTTLREVFAIAGPTPGYARLLNSRFKEHLETPFLRIPDEVKADILYGRYVSSNSQRRSYCLKRILEMRLLRNDKGLPSFYARSSCSECGGFRIGREARRVFIHGRHIGELGMMTLLDLRDFIGCLLDKKMTTSFGTNLLGDIFYKINSLIKSRLGHLALYREITTLSGGELQRLFLNSHLESKMDSLIYILDEPTAGLHESEKGELQKSIRSLKELGNTVIVVEHDRSTIQMAEHVIDIGPKAGIEGGRIIYQGDVNGLLQCEESITGQYLCGKAVMPVRMAVRKTKIGEKVPALTIRHLLTMTAPTASKTVGSRWEPLDRLRRQPDWVRYSLDQLGINGTIGEFQYSTAGAHLLSAILTRATGLCAREFANQHLFKHIGIGEIPDRMMKSFLLDDVFGKNVTGWIKDPQGYTTGGWGVTITPRDMARFGLLYLSRGHWDGKQVVSAKWVDESTAENENNYGYLWWLFDVEKKPAYTAAGSGGNHIYCIPHKDLVVAIASKIIPKPRDRWQLIEKCILPAIR